MLNTDETREKIISLRTEAIEFYASGQHGPHGLNLCFEATQLEESLQKASARPLSLTIDWYKLRGDVREKHGLPREEEKKEYMEILTDEQVEKVMEEYFQSLGDARPLKKLQLDLL